MQPQPMQRTAGGLALSGGGGVGVAGGRVRVPGLGFTVGVKAFLAEGSCVLNARGGVPVGARTRARV